MDKNTSKARVATDHSLAGAALMNASGTGTSLFVINLCASQAPVANVSKSLPGLESYRFYQVARREDGRTRYRLRLGFFTSEADADAVLGLVRSSYPTAFTTCLCDEDRKFARGFAPEPSAPPKIAVVVENKSIPKPATPPKPVAAAPARAAPAPAKPANAPTSPAPTVARDPKPAVTPPKAAAPATQPTKPSAPKAPVEIELSWEEPAPVAAKAPPTAAPAAAAAKPAAQPKAPPPKATIEAPAKLRAAIELSLESESTPAPKPSASAPSSEPFRVSKGIDVPSTSLSLESTAKMRAIATPGDTAKMRAITSPSDTAKMRAIRTPASAAPAKPVAKSMAPVAPKAQPAAAASNMKAAQAAAPAAIKDAARHPIGNVPELDSTQTIRALTSDELKDESQEKWFAIQLAASDQPVNLDAMPRLDIFEAYRLYSVATAGSGRITHSLRIGFFREEVSAEAVCGYLKTFFASPTVVRISIAEQARFKDAPAPKQAAKAEVLDLSHARDRAPKAVPTVTMEVETPRFDASATGSFKASSTGVHKALTSSSGAHRALGATGIHNALKVASKSAPPATKRSAPMSKTSATGKHKSLQPKKSLEEQLLDEAREVELSASGIRKLPKNDSLLSKMFGKLTKS